MSIGNDPIDLNIVSFQHSSHKSVATVQKEAEQRLAEQQNLNKEFSQKLGFHHYGNNLENINCRIKHLYNQSFMTRLDSPKWY